MNDYSSFFKQHQKLILKIANTEAGRELLNSHVDAPILKVSPSAIIYDWKPYLRGEFYCYDRQVKILMPIITKFLLAQEAKAEDEAFEYFKKYQDVSFILLNQKNIYVTSGDGGLFGRFVTYTTARELASATGTTNTTCGNETVGGNFEIDRGFFPVLLSDITRGAVVVSVIANVWKNGSLTTGHDDTSQFIATTQVDPTSLASGDYSQLTLNSPTSFGTSALWSSLSSGAYAQVTFNAAGKLYVQNNVTTYAKLGLRSTNDINAVSSGAPPPSDRSSIDFAYSSTSGTANDPYFDITWQGASGGIF